MGFSDAARDAAADAIGAAALRASLHTADPGTTGASEVAGGGYARQLLVWGPAVGGMEGLDANVAFSVPAGTTVTHVGLWQADGTWLGGDDVTPTTFAAAGVYTLNVATVLSVT